ncbi:MAG: ABC transporter permease [Devosia sp.]|uniref:ABC transporter permease n=1 Tax=Devosia sp. TaxID=1871048 RepID=UPI001AC2CD58|nr:ABC transporter permease [Devosia sp.]MBN9309088.1 ABC transporter permease [Devosia sp.]MBN9315735.1 ABC transporter permease [Devosia sp.]
MSVTPAIETAAPAVPLKVRLGGWGTGLMLLAVWLLLIVATGLYRQDFLSHQTLLAVTFTMAVVGVLAIGQGLVAISGGFIDLSQPANMILASLVAVRLSEAGMPLAVVIVGAILSGMLWGALNAAIVVFARLNPVIVTLATNFIGLAVLFLVFQLAEVPLNSEIYQFGRASFLGLPAIFWPMLALVLIVGLLMPRTRYGRRAIAVGGNKAAAKARGISLKLTRFAIFTIAGGFVGFASVLFAATAGPFNPGSANTLQLNIIAGVILAGISLAGGRGNFWMLLLSVGFLSTIPTSLVFFGLSSDTQSIFQGFILIIAVAIDGWRARKGTP